MDRSVDLQAASLPRSYAGHGEPALDAPPLREDIRVDVGVIGGGIVGAVVALHLVRAGASTALLEAETVGAGGSGRSFGQVVPYLRAEPGRVLAEFGAGAGERIVMAAAAGPDLVFGLMRENAIDCDASHDGLLFAAHAASGEALLRARQAWWAERDVRLVILGAGEARQAIGSGAYRIVLVEPRGGTLNPLAYTRGLVRSARRLGARIHERSPVLAVAPMADGWCAGTAGGRLRCRTLVVAAGIGVGALVPRLGRGILPIRVHEAATEPLPPDALHGILPGARALTDTRRLPSGIRRTGDGRLIVTVAGPVGGTALTEPSVPARRLAHLFPHLTQVRIAETWSGRVDLARDQYPRLLQPARGLLVGCGLSGRGLALGTLLGRDLAARALSEPATMFGGPDRPLRRWWPGARLAAACAVPSMRLLDASELRRAAILWPRPPFDTSSPIHRT